MPIDIKPDEFEIKIVDSNEVVARNLGKKVAGIVVEGYNRLPDQYKQVMFNEGLELILAGKRLASEVGFKSTSDFEIFREILHDLGVEVGKPTEVSATSTYKAWVYNKDELINATIKSKYAPTWTDQEDIDKYLEGSEKLGFDPEIVRGYIYSYPESALDFFKTYKAKNLDEQNRMFQNRKAKSLLSRSEESYISPVPLPEDVINREDFKKSFFEALDTDPEIQKIYRSGKINGIVMD